MKRKKVKTTKTPKPEKVDIVMEGDTELVLTDVFGDMFVENKQEEVEEVVEEGKGIKQWSIFDHIDNLTLGRLKEGANDMNQYGKPKYDPNNYEKIPWEEVSEYNRKSFEIYMILLWLGMHPDLVELIDIIQKNAFNGTMGKREMYKVLQGILPRKKFFIKFIKGVKEGKFNKDLIQLIADYYKVSRSIATEYLEIYFLTEEYRSNLKRLLENHGKTEKEINKLMEIKKSV